MKQVGVKELKNRATQIVREVRDGDDEYLITVNGVPAVVMRAYSDEDAQRTRRAEWEQWLAEMDALAEEISAVWPPGVSAAEAVAEQRREL